MTLSAAASTFLLFEWPIASGFVVLLALLFTQIRFLTPRIQVRLGKQVSQSSLVPSPSSSKISSANKLPNLTNNLRDSIQRVANLKFEDKIDPSLFSNFQKNLDRSTKTVNKQPSSNAPAKALKSAEGEDEVVLSISNQKNKSIPIENPRMVKPSKARPAGKVTYPGAGPSKKRPKFPKVPPKVPQEMASEPLGSIFDDIKDNDEGVSSAPKIVSHRKKMEVISSKETSPKLFEGLGEPLEAKETLTKEDFSPQKDSPETDVQLILSLSKKSLQDKTYKDGLLTIDQFFKTATIKKIPQNDVIELFVLKGELECANTEFERSARTFEGLFKQFLPKEHSRYLPVLERATEIFKKENKQVFALPFLFSVLNEYRQFGNHKKMDEIYNEIEHGYRGQQDWKRLVKTYQNHLTIKKVLKDFKGQLQLLDHLGKLYYDQKNADGSKECYEQSIAIKTEMEQPVNKK